MKRTLTITNRRSFNGTIRGIARYYGMYPVFSGYDGPGEYRVEQNTPDELELVRVREKTIVQLELAF